MLLLGNLIVLISPVHIFFGLFLAFDQALEFHKSRTIPANWKTELKEDSSSSEAEEEEEEEDDEKGKEDNSEEEVNQSKAVLAF
jgi:sortase (surface protein transpeptidase)